MADLERVEMESRPKSSPQPSKIPFRIKARRSAANYNFPRSGVSPTRSRNSMQTNDVPCDIPNCPVEPEIVESPRENFNETYDSDPLHISNQGDELDESYEKIGARTFADTNQIQIRPESTIMFPLMGKTSVENALRGDEQELINCKPDHVDGAIHNDNVNPINEPLPFTLPRCRHSHSHLFQVPDPVASQGFNFPVVSDQTESFGIADPTAFTTFSQSAINEELPSSPVLSDAPYSPGKESTSGSMMSEIISPPSSPGSACQDNWSSTEHEQEWQLCPLVTSPLFSPSPKASTTEQRMPSFQVIPLPKSSVIPSKIPCCGHLFSKMTTERTKTFHKQRNSSNYEDKFYKKKAFVTQAPAIRSPREAIPIFKNQTCMNSQQNQAMVLTRIITETITEYEVEDKQKDILEGGVENTNRSISNGSAKSHSKAPKSALKTKKYRPKSAIPKVTIITKPDEGSSGFHLSTRSAHHDSGKQPSRIPKPRLILPGHGDPHLKVPQVISPGSGSTLSEEGQLSPKNETETQPCRKCLKLKTILEECEATNRYLQQLVAGKEDELVNVKKRLQGKSNDQHQSVCKLDKTKTVDQSTSSTGIREAQTESRSSSSATGSPRGAVERRGRLECKQPLIRNPLIKKENENAQRNPIWTRPPCAIPKFDFDEFIRKYFKHIFADDSNNNHEPFEPSQLLRVSIAARDCIYHEVRHKLKSANHILRKKYDILKKVSSASQLTEEDYYALIDSYRRFVRFIYHYFDESIKDAETFDQTYTRSKSNDDKLPYYQHTTMIFDGTPYKGVFVPCDPITTSKLIL